MADARFFLVPFGCQMNKLDAEYLEGAFRRKGWLPAPREEEADVVLFLTCSVREKPERKVFSRVARIRKRGGKPLVCVAGCMAQRLKEEILRREKNVDLVLGTGELRQGADLLEGLLAGKPGPRVATGRESALPARDPAVRPSIHRAFVAVARGCSQHCAYCVVPEARGELRSRPAGEVVEEARALLETGVKEITLIAQSISGYGRDLDAPATLASLLERVHELEGLLRLRFLTSHPADLDGPSLRAVRDLPKVCHHLHLPAQSGSDRTLRSMARGYTRADYLRLVEEARAFVPKMEFTSDFIVGFPGETDADFEQTVSLVREVGFQNIFAFQYSPRPGTPAFSWVDGVASAEKRRRNRALLDVQTACADEAQAAWIGETTEILVEGVSKKDPDRWMGRTAGNRIVVVAKEEEDLAGRLVRIRVEETTPLTLFGRLEEGGENP
ncbi:MAG: tRNA (N6-isopentenyl adenosine(37)-C2)-methylthiotransferase MiaB [Planctomycetota bacterium]